MNEKNIRLAKTCNTTRKVVKVVRIFCYVAIALFVFVYAAFATWPSPCLSLSPQSSLYLAFGDAVDSVTVQDDITGAPIDYDRTDIAVKGSFVVASLVVGSFIMLLAEKVLRTVDTESTPFVKENVRRIKNIAILMATLSVVPSWFSQIIGFICGSRELIMQVELGKLVLALVVWCIALIFEYGVALQEREDETL